jgi:hypothetical protein
MSSGSHMGNGKHEVRMRACKREDASNKNAYADGTYRLVEKRETVDLNYGKEDTHFSHPRSRSA